MKRGECTKCGSNEVYVRESTVGEFGSFQSNTLPVTLFTKRYIKEQSKLEKIKEKWSKYKE
jgi:hypothetical protein